MLTAQENQWTLNGDLNFKTTPQVEKSSNQFEKALLSKDKWQINCMALNMIDSAGLAWLLSQISYSKQSQIPLQFTHLHHPNLLKLAKAQGVLDLISQYNKSE